MPRDCCIIVVARSTPLAGVADEVADLVADEVVAVSVATRYRIVRPDPTTGVAPEATVKAPVDVTVTGAPVVGAGGGGVVVVARVVVVAGAVDEVVRSTGAGRRSGETVQPRAPDSWSVASVAAS